MVLANVDLLPQDETENLVGAQEKTDDIQINIEKNKAGHIFSKEIINITALSSDESIEICSFTVQRFRLTREFLEGWIIRSHVGDRQDCPNISYLRASNGEVVPIAQMQQLCKPKPLFYHLILSEKIKVNDGQNNNNGYEGSMQFMIKHIPSYSQNGIHKVQPEHVRQWVVDGILMEDHIICRLRNGLRKQRRLLDSLDLESRRIPNSPVFGVRGNKIKGNRADKGREEKYNKLSEQKDKLQGEFDQSNTVFENTKRKRIHELQILVFFQKESNWVVKFEGVHKEYYQNLFYRKNNWSSVHMYAKIINEHLQCNEDHNTSLELLSTEIKGKEHLLSNNEYLVNIGGIIMQKVEHGYGCFHKSLSTSKCILSCNDNHVDFYHGFYIDGDKTGDGLLFTFDGIYAGKLNYNVPEGQGIMVHKDGDVKRGEFEAHAHNYKSLLRPNPYARGFLRHGTISFSDGAFYDGQMNKGKIDGEGVYISSNGDRMEGIFDSGCLINGTITNTGGEILEGSFKNGLLHGKCKMVSRCQQYKGCFVDGEKQGKGHESYHSKAGENNEFIGFFLNGKRSGSGMIKFSNRCATGDCLFKLEGYWLDGKPKAGGMVTNSTFPTFPFPTANVVSPQCVWPYNLYKIEEKERLRKMKKQIKTNQINQLFRTEFQKMKETIFDTHRKICMTKLQDRNSDCSDSPILSSKSKHFTHRKFWHGPKTLIDANLYPGLQADVQALNNNETFIFKDIIDIQSKWIQRSETNVLSKCATIVQQQYAILLEKWAVINVDQINRKCKLKLRQQNFKIQR